MSDTPIPPKDHPILFSAPMIRALLEGRKTQTRRVFKPQPVIHAAGDCSVNGHRGGVNFLMREIAPAHWVRFKVGNQLWVRETWHAMSQWDEAKPRDLPIQYVRYAADPCVAHSFGKKRAAIFMPRWASRLTLIVTDVRVQGLRDISEEDAIAEGVSSCGMVKDANGLPDWLVYHVPGLWGTPAPSARGSFAALWTIIHGSDDWNVLNPWVIALTFTVRKGNIDAA